MTTTRFHDQLNTQWMTQLTIYEINVKKKLKVSLDCKPYESENHTYKKANIIVVSLIFLDRIYGLYIERKLKFLHEIIEPTAENPLYG